MASVVTRTTSGEAGTVTSHTVTLPSGVVSGDLVISVVKFGTSTGDGGYAWPSGWYVFAAGNQFCAAYRDADGTEGASIEVLTTHSVTSTHASFRISGHEATSTQQPEGGLPMPLGYRGLTPSETYAAVVAVAERNVNATSENPGSFLMNTSATWGAATVAVHPSGGSFPFVEDRNVSRETGAVTSHTVALPSGIVSGETLVVALARQGSDDDISFPVGWTVFRNIASTPRLQLAWREADGLEGGSITVTTTGSTRSSHASLRISGATDPDTQAPEASTGATGTSAAPDPDSITPTGGAADFLMLAFMATALGNEQPADAATGNSTTPDPPLITPTGGSKAYLFLACVGYDQNADASTAPTNYSNLQTVSNYESGIGTAERELTATSENPGTFAWSGGADTWRSFTIAVHPAAAAPTGFTQRSYPRGANRGIMRGAA